MARNGLVGGLGLLVLLTVGCGAAAAPVVTTTPVVAPETRAAVVYEEALVAALDSWEADLEAAGSRWYPSYTEAYGMSQRFIHPNMTPYVERALTERGRSMDELNAFAEAHPEFVHMQNELFGTRMAEARPAAYAVMGRIDPSEVPSLPEDSPDTAIEAIALAQ